MRSHPVFSLLWALVCLSAACRTDAVRIPNEANLRETESGMVVRQCLLRQGYSIWEEEEGLCFKLRTAETGPDGDLDIGETFSCDLRLPRIFASGMAGSASRKRSYFDGRYKETLDGVEQEDVKVLVLGRERLLEDRFLTMLPFLLGEWSLDVGPLGQEAVGGIIYQIIDVKIDGGGRFMSGRELRLYFSRATQRLEKVLYQPMNMTEDDRKVWCDFDNFTKVDGALIPFYREFTYQDRLSGGKSEAPFRRQWLDTVRFEDFPEEAFFNAEDD